jgi:hypothetical protein
MTKYTITHNHGMLPNQISGHTDDGRHFYFRGRHGYWTLGFGATHDEAVEAGHNAQYSGDALGAGWFELDEWERCFWDVIDNCVEKGRPFPTFAAHDIAKYRTALQGIHDEILPKSQNWSIPVHEVISIIRQHHPDWRS